MAPATPGCEAALRTEIEEFFSTHWLDMRTRQGPPEPEPPELSLRKESLYFSTFSFFSNLN